MPFIELPSLPVPLADLPRHLADHPDTPVTELFAPFLKFEDTLRSAYAQEPDHPALKDPLVNVVSVFGDGKTEVPPPPLRVRARNPAAETEAERAGYIMPLPDSQRRATGSLATVATLDEFQSNFGIFSEGALAEMDWSNVVAAGSSVVNCLLPVPASVAGTTDGGRPSRRALRTYYHETFCPASDVDLFLYGLTPAQAEDKIRQIEAAVRDAVLAETVTVRTRHAVTICSEYPTRHIQIVLRLYGSVSEILAGFDVDCSAAAYNGGRVWCAPRALQALATQCNHVDLARRSPSYETRLAKYSHRGFEVCWPPLDRSRIDPTLFDRSFARTRGLARLLVLERLPTAETRQNYAEQRRCERRRPPLNDGMGGGYAGSSNLKVAFADEIGDWVYEMDVSGYETFVLPYGRKYTAKKIEKLCYTQDLLLNAEWNQKKDREVYLHRHPAFFGRADDILGDCCGCCPAPVTDREKEIAADESKIYVSGKISFLTDDPGRQQIGSFHPLTDDDWTDMAYIGNTARFCQAIVDGDIAYVRDWLAQGGDPNRRDHTGRTPLHLAVLCATAEIVQCLADHGARLVARLADGRTALHIAAQRGDTAIVKILLDKSAANEAEEEEKEIRRREAKRLAAKEDGVVEDKDKDNEDEDEDEDDGELVEGEDAESDSSSVEARTATTGSVVEVSKKKTEKVEDYDAADDNDEPDVYDINAPAWDRPYAPLHCAIAHGHEAVVWQLCQDYGADVLQPIKAEWSHMPTTAVLTLELVRAVRPAATAGATMARTLVALGATVAQADLNGATALQKVVEAGRVAIVEALVQSDPAGAATAMRHIRFTSEYRSVPGMDIVAAAAKTGNVRMVQKLLEAGAAASVSLEMWLKAGKSDEKVQQALAHLTAAKAGAPETSVHDRQRELFLTSMDQPLIAALASPNPKSALALLAHGANPHARPREAYENGGRGLSWLSKNDLRSAASALEMTRRILAQLRKYTGVEMAPQTHYSYDRVKDAAYRKPLLRTDGAEAVVAAQPADSWRRWAAAHRHRVLEAQHETALKTYERTMQRIGFHTCVGHKKAVINDMITALKEVEAKILAAPPLDKADVPEISKKAADFDYGSDMGSDAGADDDAKKTTTTTQFFFTPEFENMPDATTDVRRNAYTRLYEAAWTGDLATIKQLTLAAWMPEAGEGGEGGEGGEDGGDPEPEPPLNLGVRDGGHGRPVSLAFMRGHYDVAAALLAIAHAQHAAGTDGDDKTPHVRYRLRAEGEPESDRDSCCDSETEGGSDDGDNGSFSIRRLYRSLADNTSLTVHNIGEVSMKVKCAATPLELLTTFCAPSVVPAAGLPATDPLAPSTLFRFVAEQDDSRALRILLDLADRFAALHDPVADPNDVPYVDAGGGGSRFFRVPDDDVRALMRHGRLDMLATVLKRTGVCLPLDDLVKKAGVAAADSTAESSSKDDVSAPSAEQPANAVAPSRAGVRRRIPPYQGLIVYGKKRGDWAAAGRRRHGDGANSLRSSNRFADQISPLLLAASAGSRASVEWFLAGDGPRRAYLAFLEARANAGDARAKQLCQARGGWEGAVSRWLDRDRDLVLHSAVAGDWYDANQVALVAFLASAVPKAAAARDSEGRTPLLMAAELGRLEMVRVLLEVQPAGDEDADAADPALVRQKGTGENLLHAALRHKPQVQHVKALLALLPPATQTLLFSQRSHHSAPSKGRTPLHHWLATWVPPYDDRNGDSGTLYDTATGTAQHTYDVEDVDKSMEDVQAVLEVLLAHSGGCELGLLDSTGETLLHTLVGQMAHPRFLRTVLERNRGDVWPNGVLLRRENAVGATPLDQAQDLVQANLLPSSRHTYFWFMTGPSPSTWKTTAPREFRPVPADALAAASGDEDDVENFARPLGQRLYTPPPAIDRAADIYRLLAACADQSPGPRRMASLLEANDVAERIATTYADQRYPAVGKAADKEAKNEAKEAEKKKTKAYPWIPPEVMGTAWSEIGERRETRGKRVEVDLHF